MSDDPNEARNVPRSNEETLIDHSSLIAANHSSDLFRSVELHDGRGDGEIPLSPLD